MVRWADPIGLAQTKPGPTRSDRVGWVEPNPAPSLLPSLALVRENEFIRSPPGDVLPPRRRLPPRPSLAASGAAAHHRDSAFLSSIEPLLAPLSLLTHARTLP
jgi:hypothetical protein